MAIPEKPDHECSEVRVNLCGESKKIVKAKQKELQDAGYPRPGKGLAILKIILGK